MDNVKVYIVRESDGSYSSYMEDNANLPYTLVGEGATAAEAIAEWRQAYSDMRAAFEEEGRKFVEAQFTFAYDLPSFLVYYADLISYRGLAKLTGVSAAQLSQYVSGYRKPSPRTTRKIEAALHAFGSELTALRLV